MTEQLARKHFGRGRQFELQDKGDEALKRITLNRASFSRPFRRRSKLLVRLLRCKVASLKPSEFISILPLNLVLTVKLGNGVVMFGSIASIMKMHWLNLSDYDRARRPSN